MQTIKNMKQLLSLVAWILFLPFMPCSASSFFFHTVDVKDGFVAVRGWRVSSPLTAEALCGRLPGMGIAGVILTDVSRDGAMRGSNTALYERMTAAFPELEFVASGGVSNHEDLLALRAAGCWGTIVGKAYYTGAVDLARAIGETA